MVKNKTNSLSVVIVIMVVLILLFGIIIGVFYHFGSKAAASGTGELPVDAEKTSVAGPPVRIGMNPWAGYAHAYLAQEKGIFLKNGVNVEIVYDDDSVVTKERYVNGELDGTFEVYTDTLFQDSEGIRTKVVYVADYSTSGDVIIAKPGINSLKDLKGKKIGVDAINGFSHLFVLTDLLQNGLKESDVQFKAVPAMTVLTAIESGEIDAGHTWEPVTSQALSKGYKVIGQASDVPLGIITDVLVFHSDFVEKNPEKVQAIVKSMIEARDLVYSDPNASVSIMASSMGWSEADMAGALTGMIQPDLQANIRIMTDSGDKGTLYDSGNLIAEFYMARGGMSMRPKFDEIITPVFLENIR